MRGKNLVNSGKQLLRRARHAGINLVVAAGFIVVALVAGVGLMMASNHTSLSSISSLFSMQGAGGAMSDLDGIAAGAANVAQNGTAISQIAFNGVTAATYVVPSVNGIACVSAAGSITTTAANCTTLQPDTVSGYTAQVFSPYGGNVTLPVPNSANTNSAQQYYFTTWQVEDSGGNNLGTSTPDIVAVLLDAKEGVCENVNNTLWGDSKVATAIPASGVATNGGLVSAAGTVVITSLTSAGARDKGCVSTADGKFALFEVLAAQ